MKTINCYSNDGELELMYKVEAWFIEVGSYFAAINGKVYLVAMESPTEVRAYRELTNV